MKNTKSILIVLMMVLGASIFSQNNAKVIVVVNKADWCSICRANGQRAMETFMGNNTDQNFQLVIHDVTTEESKKQSNVELTQLGLSKIINDHNGTGIFYFFDAKSKKILAQISVANTNEEIKMTMDKLK